MRGTGRIILLYGSREPGVLLFREELVALSRQGRIDVRFSVDFAETLPAPYDGVFCKIGLVTELLVDLDFNPRKTRWPRSAARRPSTAAFSKSWP